MFVTMLQQELIQLLVIFFKVVSQLVHNTSIETRIDLKIIVFTEHSNQFKKTMQIMLDYL